MSKQIYNFGVNKELARPEERKTLAWPVAVWSCLIPDTVAPKINILEKLILKLVSMDVPNVKETLCSKIGFSRDLVDAAIESCYVKGYLDKRKMTTGNMALNVEGKELLDSIENPYERDMEVISSGVTRKVYMIQDLVTKSVIPCFDIDKLPSSYFEDEEAIVVRYDNWENKKPSIASVQTALRYWARLQNNLRNGFYEGKNTLDVSTSEAVSNDLDDEISGFIPFEEEEVDWKTIGQDIREDEPTTLADIEEKEKNEFEKITQLTIFDDRPEVYYAMGYLAINRNNPDEAMVLSPFGERLDDWFRTVINRLKVTDKDFDNELRFFLEVKREELGDKIAFNNDLDIKLFDDFPVICNNPKYAFLKQAVLDFTKSKIRICNNDDDSHNFNRSMRTALEIFFRCMFSENTEIAEEQSAIKKLDEDYKKKGSKGINLGYEKYKDNLRTLVNTYSFLSEEVFNIYKGYRIYQNFLNSTTDNGYTNGYLAMILMDALKHKDGKCMRLLYDFQEFPVKVIGLTREGNDSAHGGKAYLKTHYNPEEAEEKYNEFENIVASVYGHFMEG